MKNSSSNKLIELVFFCLLTVFISANAAAEDDDHIIWSSNAMACVPAGAPIVVDNHESLAGKVRFKEGKRGKVALICPIHMVTVATGKSPRSLHLTYRDGDGKQGNSLVSAVLRKVRRSNGQVETIVNSVVSSNATNAANSGVNGWATHQSATTGNTIGQRFDFLRYYYYVQINMDNTSGTTLAVMGVYLTK